MINLDQLSGNSQRFTGAADGTFEIHVPGATADPLRAWFQRQNKEKKQYWFAHARDIDPSVELKVELKARE